MLERKARIPVALQTHKDSVFDDGKSQTTSVCSNSVEGIDNTSSDERDDNHSIAGNSLSNSSTLYVTEPLSPINHASITEPLGPNRNTSVTEPLTPNRHALIKELLEANNKASSGSHEQHQQNNLINCEQEVLQTMDMGSSEIHNIDKLETQVYEECVTGAEKQQAQTRLHLSINFQTDLQIDQFAEDDNFHYDSVKIKSRRHKARRKNEVKHEKCDKGKNNFEDSPSLCVDGHSLKRSMDEVQYGSFEELQKEKSYEELLQLSRSQQSSFRSQDSYPGCSSPTCSLQSTDSLDQFCKDFESSINLTSEKSPNVPTLKLCDNKGWSDLGDAEINKEQGFSIDDSLVLTTSTDNTDQGSSNASPNYEGIILGLPKRPLLQQLPVTSCDVSVDQNTMLALSLEVFEKNGEQFHRMLVLMCGHLSSQLYFLHVLLTDHAIYLLRKVPSHEGKIFQVHLAFPFTTLKKIEVGLNCQTVTLASRSQKCVLFVADEAVTRDFLSSLTSMIVKSGHGSLLSKIVSTSTFQQETLIKKWLCGLENVQSCSMDIRCYTFVQWCGLSGPDANVEVLGYQSVKEGYMDCKPPQHLRRTYKWTTSYFVLMNGILFQHVNQGDQAGKVVVKLRGSQCGGCRRVNDSERLHAFEIVAEDGSPLILLAAFSEDAAADWIFRLCQAVAETCDSEDEMSCPMMNCVPCCLILTNVKIVACLPKPTTEETFEFLSECSVESVTRLFLDNDVRNYCILEFERSELAGTESSWFVWFKTEYELAKFERGLLQAWQELFQIDLQFLVLGEGSMRAVARQKAKNIEDLYKSQLA